MAGERIYVPARAEFNVEHEREGNEEEIEFQLKWTINELTFASFIAADLIARAALGVAARDSA